MSEGRGDRGRAPETVVVTDPGSAAFQLGAITAATRAMISRRTDALIACALIFVVVLSLLFGLNALSPRAPDGDHVILGMLLGVTLLWLSYRPVAWLGRRRFLTVCERHLADGGRVEIVLDAEGCRTRSDIGGFAVPWNLVGEVLDVPHGLVVRAGLFVVPLADSALPPGTDRDDLKARIAAWRGAA